MTDHTADAAITDYLLKLQTAKRSLPHGQLVCIAASPNISTTDSLLRFANILGPYMAVLQVQADIIDDWSPFTATQLEAVASQHGFLLWEGGRILLDAPKHSISAESSSGEVQKLIDIAKKRYTKGVVNIASWANITSSYLIVDDSSPSDGSPVEGNHDAVTYGSGMATNLSVNSKLATTLQKASREVVMASTNTFSTEISAGNDSPTDECRHCDDDDDNDDDDKAEDPANDPHSINYDGDRDDGDSLSCHRKPSMISLTHTITQVTEVAYASELSITEAVANEFAGQLPLCPSTTISANSNPSTGATTPTTPPQELTTLPPMPLKSRALIVALSSIKGVIQESYSELCKRLNIQRGDFVLGAFSARPWIPVSCLNGRKRPYDDMNAGRTFLMFAPLEKEHVFPKSGLGGDNKHSRDCSERDYDYMGNLDKSELAYASPAQQEQIKLLHCIIGRALRMRQAVLQKTPQTTPLIPGQDTAYIPIITMNI